MDKNKLTIAYVITNDNYQAALVSIQSLVESNKTNLLELNLIHDETFNQANSKFFKKYEDKFKFVKVNFVPVQKSKYSKLNNIEFNESLYSFEIPYLIESEKVLYLSASSLITKDLSFLYSMDVKNHHCIAPDEVNIRAISEYFKIDTHRLFSMGTMLLNIEKLKEDNILADLLAFKYLENTTFDGIIPASLIPSLLMSAKHVSMSYNYVEYWHVDYFYFQIAQELKSQYKKFSSHVEIPAVIGFDGRTPIGNEPCLNSYTSLWWEYAEYTEIYKDIKHFRNVGKFKLSATTAQNAFKYSWLLSRIFPYIKPYLFRIFLGFAVAIPLGLLDGVTAFALKPYMDYVVTGNSFNFEWKWLHISITSMQMAFILPVGVVLFAALQGVLRYLNGYLSTWTSARITNDVKFDLFHRLIHMHPQFYDDNSSGIIISRYMSDPGVASSGIVENIKVLTTSFCGALGLIVVMLYSSWKLAFIGVLVLCIAFIPVVLIRRRIREASNKNLVIGGNITTNINETYSGNKVMAAYGLQDRQEDFFKEKVWESYNVGMSLYKRAGWMSPMMYLIASFGIAIVLGVGTYLINSGQMTAGSFASFVTSLLLLYKPVKTLGNTLTGIQGIFVAMGRVFELFDLDPAIKEKENPTELKGLHQDIVFKDVEFEYIPNKPVLKNFNLTVKKNETLAIVGNSGGGKSTLVNLIPRFYDITKGSISIDGTDIRELSLNSLRHSISMVFQDNFLFSGTIKENILMGNPYATGEELLCAIRSAHLEEMISDLPNGLDTRLGERGLTLSGGQRQRVAIARALLRNAPIVILDEATSALDNESEAIVQKAMDNLIKDRTVFIIAHRLSTIKNADRIAVINEGELVELGTHEELMKIPEGQYKHLYEMQFKKQELALTHA